MSDLLCECGKLRRKGGRQCSACYMAKYRKTTTGKAASQKAGKQWRKKHPDKAKYHDTVYKKQWRSQTHFYVPREVHDLRKALKRLEQALAKAEQHQRVCCSGQQGSNDGVEW